MRGLRELSIPLTRPLPLAGERRNERSRLLDQCHQLRQSGSALAHGLLGPSGKMGRLDGQTPDALHRALFVQKPGPVQGKQALAKAGEGAEGAARDIGCILAAAAMVSVLQGKRASQKKLLISASANAGG